METRIENGNLIISIKLQEPIPSTGGKKRLVVASTHGNLTTTAQVKGQPVVVGLNAYIRRG